MAEHNTLTDPYLHEPKGAASASAGTVYQADGAGSGSWVALEDDRIPAVTTADNGKIITPSATTDGDFEVRALTSADLSDYFPDHGQLLISNNTTATSLTAATDATLKTNSDYTQVSAAFDATPHGLNFGVTQGADYLEIVDDGIYRISFWANTKSDTNATLIGFKFAINGIVSVVRRPTIFHRTASEIHSGAGDGLVQLSAGDVVTLLIASDKTANVTIEDCVFQLYMIRPL